MCLARDLRWLVWSCDEQIRNLLKRFDDTTCTEEHGYFVAVTRIESVGEGTIREGKGCITFPVSFRGLTFMPLTGEIVFGTVSKVRSVPCGHINANPALGPFCHLCCLKVLLVNLAGALRNRFHGGRIHVHICTRTLEHGSAKCLPL